jgi:hypothetical protein
MITIDIVHLHVQQYLNMIIRTNEVVDLEDLLLIPAIGRK